MHTHLTSEEWEGGSFLFTDLLSTPFKYYLKFAYSLADHLICPSEYNRKLMETYSENPKTVVSNGVDKDRLEGFEELREEYLEKYDLEEPVVFCVGLVLKRKGLKTFIETARKMPELDFVWFGYLHENLKTKRDQEHDREFAGKLPVYRLYRRYSWRIRCRRHIFLPDKRGKRGNLPN